MSTEVIIKFHNPAAQPNNGITRIVGYVTVKGLIPLIDNLDLDANPRSSKIGPVVKSIEESLEETPDIFPFKTKGVLLAATEYQSLERGRYRVTFNDLQIEGILDGGHNMLAIGMYILKRAKEAFEESTDSRMLNAKAPSDKDLKQIKNWDNFKSVWTAHRDVIDWYVKSLRHDDDAQSIDATPLDINVPVELLVPEWPDDAICRDELETDLLDICSARNNNVQLAASTKANKHGYFDNLKALLKAENPSIEQNVEWKSNNGGTIKPQDIITLTWIPLSLIPAIQNGEILDENNKVVDAPSPVTLYSGKETAMTKFDRLMSSKDVTEHNNSQGGLKSLSVESALKIAAQLPALYDKIYTLLPSAYNKNGGKYGGIKAVSELNKGRGAKKTPFGGLHVETASPQGFIAPLVYGLQALMTVKTVNGVDQVVWRDGINPDEWISTHLTDVAKRFSNIMVAYNLDPGRVGKSTNVYESALDDYKLVLAGL